MFGGIAAAPPTVSLSRGELLFGLDGRETIANCGWRVILALTV